MLTSHHIYTLPSFILLVIVTLKEAKGFFSLIKINNSFDKKLIWLLAGLLFALLLLIWPGMISIDDFYLLSAVRNGGGTSFVGPVYSGIINFLHLLHAEFYILCTLQLVFHVFLFAKALFLINSLSDSVIEEKWSKNHLLKVLSLLFFLSPLAINLTLFQNRDALFSILFCHLIFYLVFSIRFSNHRFSVENNIKYFFCLALLTLGLRQDALLNLITLPALLLLIKIISWRKHMLILVAYFTTAVFIASASALPNTENFNYQSTAFINPLSYLIHKNGVGILTDQQKEKINNVIKIDYMIRYYSPLEIDAFHHGGLNYSASLADYQNFFKTCYQLFYDYKVDFLRNRLQVYLHSINVLPTNYIGGDNFSNNKTDFNYSGSYFLSAFRDPIIKWITGSAYYSAIANSFTRIVFFSLSVHFLIFLFLIIKVRKFPREMLVVAWILLRAPILFLFEPASIFKYHYCIYFCFLFVVIHLYFTLSKTNLKG